jgi:hypothetical protein
VPVDLAAVRKGAAQSGAVVLTDVEEFLSRFVAYPSPHARVAHVLWVAHTHLMELWESTPRIAFLSPEPGSGKSRSLEVTALLVPRPVHAVNTTSAYLFRKVVEEEGLPTILYDEIDTVFGPRAKENEDIRGMLNAGHRKGAVAGRCVVRGKEVLTEELPAYCAVAMAGLEDLPDTLMSRSVVVRMRRRAPTESVEPFRYRLHAPEGWAVRDALTAWTSTVGPTSWPDMPEGIEDRNADVWEALLAIACAAGGSWPDRARVAAVTLVTDAQAAPPSLGIRLLTDLQEVFDGRDHLFTEDIIAALTAMDDAPWAEVRGKPLDARGLAHRLAKYEVKPRTVRVGGRTSKGYARADLVDPWSRYVTAVSAPNRESSKAILTKPVGIQADHLGAPPKESVTSVTPATSQRAPVDIDDLDDDQFDGWDDDAPPPTAEDFERWEAQAVEAF